MTVNISRLGLAMRTTLDLLSLVTLTLTLVSSPSHESPHHNQRKSLSQLLDHDDTYLPATVSETLQVK